MQTTETTTTYRIPADVIGEMRAWIADCVWGDLEPGEIDELSDREILQGVRRHYSGGVEEFLRAL